jgi:hypothetical protein
MGSLLGWQERASMEDCVQDLSAIVARLTRMYHLQAPLG